MKKLILTIAVVLLSTALSFSQNPNPQCLGSSWRVFDHLSFENADNSFKITGLWNTKDIDSFNIMCVWNGKKKPYQAFIFLCNEKQGNSWTNSLTQMKELFLKNDQIAKDNNVSTPIEKEVSDKFEFTGLYGEERDNGPLTKQYNGRGHAANIRVLYKYNAGHSSMELYIYDYYLGSAKILWKFDSVQDFDKIIHIMNWNNFISNFNEQVKEYQKQQAEAEAAAAKEKANAALFD